MILSDVEIGKTYTTIACAAPIKTRNKLETLGLVPGEEIAIIQKTGAGVIVEVKRSRLAIARDLAKTLEVSPADRS
jgi:Fe2+ transport system protein FeoA